MKEAHLRRKCGHSLFVCVLLVVVLLLLVLLALRLVLCGLLRLLFLPLVLFVLRGVRSVREETQSVQNEVAGQLRGLRRTGEPEQAVERGRKERERFIRRDARNPSEVTRKISGRNAAGWDGGVLFRFTDVLLEDAAYPLEEVLLLRRLSLQAPT